MKKILLILLLLPCITQAQKMYALRFNANSTVDTFFVYDGRAGVWNSANNYIMPRLDSMAAITDFVFPQAVGKFTLGADGIYRNFMLPNSDGSTLTGITQAQVSGLVSALAGKLATNGNGSSLTGITESQITNLTTDLAAKQATLVSGSNIKTINGASVLGSTDIVTTRKVTSVDIAARSTAVSTTTLFTPSASGMYRLSIYMKITTTGTSPVAGPVTITYNDADGSVAQSHIMLLQSVTGTVVTNTVNNSTTTGTVNGSMIFNAKTGVAIQYAIAVSGTFGAGAYTAHITLEAL